MRKPQQSEAKERGREKPESCPPSPKTPRRKGKLGVGVSLPYLSLYHTTCATPEARLVGLTTPKEKGVGAHATSIPGLGAQTWRSPQ